MTQKTIFYEHVLKRDQHRGLSEQLFDALRHEILRGRWQVGEKIPSYNDLTEQTGLSRTPVQSALRRLEAGGYVECIRHKGVFVKATVTPANRTLGSVLIPVPDAPETGSDARHASVYTQCFGWLSVDHLTREAQRLGLKTNISRLSDVAGTLCTDESAADSTFGVISMLPPGELAEVLEPRLLGRVVYVGVDDPLARPCLSGDPYTAAYMVAQELVQRGHTRIGLWQSPLLSPATDASVRAGIARAADLATGTSILPDVTGSSATFPCGVTAVFCLGIEGARECVREAHARRLRVPQDLSVVCLQACATLDESTRIPGAAYMWDDMLTTCFDLLLESDNCAGSSVSRQTFTPHVDLTGSLAPPKSISNPTR